MKENIQKDGSHVVYEMPRMYQNYRLQDLQGF